MSDITFLEESQIIGENQLEIFKKYGIKSAITDFSILLGGIVSETSYTNDINGNRRGWYWTRTYVKKDIISKSVVVITEYGLKNIGITHGRQLGCRPTLPFSSIKKDASKPVKNSNDVIEIQYGEYPRMVSDSKTEKELEAIYEKGLLNKTSKVYTADAREWNNYSEGFMPRTFSEYKYNGQKYIRFIGDVNSKERELSDGRKIESGKPYWIKVEPIVWLVDEKVDIAVSKELLFSGVQFQCKGNYRGNFSKTDIKKFMDDYFVKEIVVDRNQLYSEEEKENEQVSKINKKTTRKQNPYNFDMSEVSEEDIIRGAIESNIAVFLHGRSSEGKSARVKQIDPNCEIIYLRNATPDSLNGKSVYNSETGEMIDVPPSWYKKITTKCEEEPDKLHILFFDELTNALPSIQGMAFNIILDKEVNGVWKLPDNCRIVAAGNDLNDSLAANTLAEPLFNRFAHVYIETTVASWLRWAAKKENHIHPSIYAYIAYKSCLGSDVLRSEYNGEKPNADPRKWEMASKVLWSTRNPSMLRALIGEALTNDFVGFCKQQVITIEDVLKGNYSKSDLEMDLDEKFATTIGLSSCDIKDLKVIREFVGKLGPEIQATFDVLWSHGEEDRLEEIAKLKIDKETIKNR